MILNIASSVAFYCQRCGKIHVFDIPFFSGKEKNILRCENCSRKIATVSLERGKNIVIETYCGVCQTKNKFKFSLRNLNKKSFEKIFCINDGFELGYIGKWEAIAEFLDYTQTEYESLYPNEVENFSDSQQILLEAVNMVHDLAEMGEIICPCESHHFRAEVDDESILLRCKSCDSYTIIPAKNSNDLKQLQKGISLKFYRTQKQNLN